MLYNKRLLSGSTNGQGIVVAQNATPGTTVHQAVSGVNDFDEIHLYAVNIGTVQKKLTVEWGGVTGTQNIEATIPGESGLVTVIPGLVLNGGLTVTAFAETINVVILHGYVNRLTAQ